MKPMALNMSKMKKVAGDKHSSTFQHDDGHMIKIAHSALPALQRKQMEKLPIHPQKMADGGLPSSFDDFVSSVKQSFAAPSPTPSGPTQDEKNEAIRKQNRQNFDNPSNDRSGGFAKGGMVKMADGGDPELNQDSSDTVQINPGDLSGPQQPSNAEWSDPVADAGKTNIMPPLPESESPTQPQQQPVSQTQPTSNGLPNLEQSTRDELGAIKQKGNLEAQQSAADANALQSDMDARKGFEANVQTANQEALKHQQDLLNDMAQGHINPDAYIQNMGSGQKISTAIGLLLGGISVGLGGKSNPAMDFLNKEIDNNIRAQQDNLGLKKSVYEGFHQLYGDNVLAQNATRAAMAGQLAQQIQLNAAKIGTPMAINNAKIASDQLLAQSQTALMQNSMRQGVLKQMQAGGTGLNAHDLATAGFMSPEQAEKEQTSIDAQKTAVAQANNILDQMDKTQHLSNRVMNPIQSHSEMENLKAQLVNTVMAASPSKRLNPEAVKLQVEPFVTKLTENETTRAHARQGLLNVIKQSADPTPVMSQYAKGSLPNYTAPAAPEASIPMLAPNGRSVMVPQSQVQNALKQGAKKVN